MGKREKKRSLTKNQLKKEVQKGFLVGDECLVCRQGTLVKRDNEVLIFVRKGVVMMPGIRPEELLPLECCVCGTGFKERVLSCYVGQICPSCKDVSAIVVKGGKRKPLPLADGMASLTKRKPEPIPPLECRSCSTRFKKKRKQFLRPLIYRLKGFVQSKAK